MKLITLAAIAAIPFAIVGAFYVIETYPSSVDKGTVKGCTEISEKTALVTRAFHDGVPLHEFMRSTRRLEPAFHNMFQHIYESEPQLSSQEEQDHRIFTLSNDVFLHCMKETYD